MKNKKKNIWLRGSATIEMSILMPMLFILLLLLIYLGFYLFDRTVLYGDAYEAGLSAVSDPDASNEEAYRIAKEKMDSLTEEQLIAMPIPDISITVSYDMVSIAYEGTVSIPVPDQNRFFPEWEFFPIGGEVRVQRHKPVTFIRQCRKLEKLAETMQEESNE